METATLGNAASNFQPLVDTLADTLAEVETVTLGDSVGDAHYLNDVLADALAEV